MLRGHLILPYGSLHVGGQSLPPQDFFEDVYTCTLYLTVYLSPDFKIREERRHSPRIIWRQCEVSAQSAGLSWVSWPSNDAREIRMELEDAIWTVFISAFAKPNLLLVRSHTSRFSSFDLYYRSTFMSARPSRQYRRLGACRISTSFVFCLWKSLLNEAQRHGHSKHDEIMSWAMQNGF